MTDGGRSDDVLDRGGEPDTALSLYLKLKPGSKADLEIVSKASLHWAAALRAAAEEIDPSADIQFLLLDAEEGSLQLNVVLAWAENKIARLDIGSSQYPRLRKIAVALTLFVTGAIASNYIDHFLDGPDAPGLTKEDKDFIRSLIEEAQASPEAEAERRQFFRTLEGDPSISGVGMSEHGSAAPSAIVPSTEFGERSGLWKLESEPPLKRKTYPEVEVVLVSPVLLKSARRWKFFDSTRGEFSALMKDERFLAALDEDHIRERLRTGIAMTVRLAVIEDYVDGVWVERRNRSVLNVLSPQPQ